MNGNVGTFDPNNVTVGAELVLSLTQTQQGSQIFSSGSEVMTKQTFTYGTFEFTSRVDNVLSGSDSSGFLYASDSITEIDMEQVGNKPDAVDCTNWKGVSNFQDTEVTGFHQGNSHDFQIIWAPTHVDWYVDGTLVVSHTEAVPSTAAPFLFNMWGTNKSSWGGMATIGPTRYMYISNFKYTRNVASEDGLGLNAGSNADFLARNLQPAKKSAIASTTVSCCSSVICGKTGRARTCRLASSACGNAPCT